MAIKSMKDLDSINLANHEFTGDELGALLLESVRQAKAGQGVAPEQPLAVEAISRQILSIPAPAGSGLARVIEP